MSDQQDSQSKNNDYLITNRKIWGEVYGEKKDSILKREDIVEPEEEVVEVIKEKSDDSDKIVDRKIGKGGIKTQSGVV